MRAWLLVLVGCGRLHFDTIGSGDDDDANGDAATTPLCTPSPEVCNGIDDNCNGLVDEGCPCTPFTQTYTVRLRSAVSTGVDWWLATTTSTLLRIDGTTGVSAGTIPTPGGAAGSKQQIAWDGSNFVALVQDQLAWFDTTGAQVRIGPHTLLPPDGSAVLAWNGGGFDVVVSNAAFDEIDYVRTDASGAPTTPIAKVASPATSYPVAIGIRAGKAFVVWGVLVNVGNMYAEVGVPDGTTLTMSPRFGGAAPGEDGASDGTRALASAGYLYLVDDSGVSALQPMITGPSVAWAGNGWDFAVEQASNPELARLGHVDPTLAVTGPVTVLQLAYGTSINSDLPTVVSDARRSLVSWNAGADGAMPVGRVAQVCH